MHFSDTRVEFYSTRRNFEGETVDKMTNIDMWLVYVDVEGQMHSQHWSNLAEIGTLIDPENGEDMDVIGWTTEAP